MDPDSVRGRLVLSIVDKLLIGIAATVVVAYIQAGDRRNAVLEEQRLAVSRVVTGVLSEQQSQLMLYVSEFLVLAEGLIPAGRALGANAEELDRLEEGIRGAVAVIETIQAARPQPAKCEPGSNGPESGSEGAEWGSEGADTGSDGLETIEGVAEDGRGVLGEFTAAIEAVATPLVSHGVDPDELRVLTAVGREKYVDVLAFLRCLNVDTVEHEISSARERGR